MRVLCLVGLAGLAGLVLLCGCREAAVRTSGGVGKERVWVVPAPAAELVLEVYGDVQSVTPEEVEPPVGDLRLEWLASEGSVAEEGEVVARFDTELLELFLDANREELETLQRRSRAVNLKNERSLYTMRARLLDAEADRKAVEAEILRSRERDAAERGVLEEELALARETLAEARERLGALQSVAASGGAAASEVREAMLAVQRAVEGIRVPRVKLDVFDEEDGSEERLTLERRLRKLGLELGAESDHGSLRSRIARFVAEQRRDWDWLGYELEELDRETEDAREVVSDAVVRSERGGLVRGMVRDGEDVPLVPGAELGTSRLLEVAPSEALRIVVWIPEGSRDAVALKPGERLPVRVRIPSISSVGEEAFEGHLVSVGAVKESGQSVYRGVVELAEMPAEVRLGAKVIGELVVAVSAGDVVIPRWWATREFRPVVRMASGEERRLTARAVGDSLLVLEGLSVGDRLVAPPVLEGEGRLVLVSEVELEDRVELKVGKSRPYEWSVLEVVENGSQVTNGQVVARLRRAYGRSGRSGREASEEAIRTSLLKAEAARDLNRMLANGRLGTAFMNWQKAKIDTEKARLEVEIARREMDESAREQAAVSASLAGLERRRAEEELARFGKAEYEEIRSVNQRSRDELTARISVLADEQAGRDALAARHQRNWISIWELKQTWKRLAATEQAMEQAYKRAEETHRRELTAVEATFEKAEREAETTRKEIGGRRLVAPMDGMIMHNTKTYRPLRVGRRLPSIHVYSMSTGPGRSFELNVPARYYGGFSVGQELRFFLPAEGARAYVGRVSHVADFFEQRVAPKGSYWSRRRGGGGDDEDGLPPEVERTFRVRVAFESGGTNEVPAGTTVVVEL